MTESLRADLGDVVGPAGARPDLAVLWRDGRRRRRRARAVPIAAVAVLVLVVAAVLVVARAGGDESVVTSGPARCTPPPQRGVVAPPRTVAEFVRGSGDGRVLRPTVVARVEVLRVWRIKVVDRSNELLDVGLPPVVYERQADVRVIGPVVGARRGRHFAVSDSATVRARGTKRRLMREIDDHQIRLDADPGDSRVQAELLDLQERLQIFEMSERLSDGSWIEPTPCHALRKGDELVLAIRRSPRAGPIYELTNPSSFFLVDGDQLSPELDAARRSVAAWPDTPLARLARRSSPDELVAALRAAR